MRFGASLANNVLVGAGSSPAREGERGLSAPEVAKLLTEYGRRTALAGGNPYRSAPRLPSNWLGARERKIGRGGVGVRHSARKRTSERQP
jgi:hypothetical protein